MLRLVLKLGAKHDVAGEATTGHEAVDAARNLAPDLVILDVVMPEMHGLKALPLLKAAVPGVRVLVYTAKVDLEEEAFAAGAEPFSTRPPRSVT